MDYKKLIEKGGLLGAGAVLVASGAAFIETDFLKGIVAVLLGVGVFVLREVGKQKGWF